MRGSRFAVSLPWEVEDGVTVNIFVRGRITPYVPPTFHDPAEGAELEDLEIGNEKGCPLPGIVAKRLEADVFFLEKVTRLAEQSSQPDWDSINKAEKEA